MVFRGKEFNEIYDLVGVRILVDSPRDCYAALGAIHSLWKPDPRPLQGLHRDAQVEHVPVAAHHGGGSGRQAARDPDANARHAPHGASSASRRTGATRRAASRRGTPPTSPGSGQMMEWLKDMADPREFMEGLKIDLYGGQVFVFTPKGDVVNLPSGATPVDFAYAIHTDVGHRTIGAKVGGKLVPLDYELRTGDAVDDPDLQGPGRGAVAGLAAVREDAAGPVEDPAVVRARAPRGRPGARARRRPAADAQAEPADQAARDRRLAHPGRRPS